MSWQNIARYGLFAALLGVSFSNSVTGIGLGVYAAALAIRSFSATTRPHAPYPLWKLLLVLLASLAVSTAISHHLFDSLKGFGKYLQGFLLLYAALDTLDTEDRARDFLAITVLMYFVAALDGLWQQFAGKDLLRQNLPIVHHAAYGIVRLTGAFKHSNDFGTFLIPGFALAAALFLNAWRNRSRASAAAAVLLFALLGYVLMSTLSRGALLAAFASLFFFCFFFRFRWIACGLVAALVALLWTVPSPLQERLHELTALGTGDTSERVVLIRTSLRMIAQNPFFGLGLNTYSDYFPQFKPADYPAYMYTHNSYLQMAAESGWLGLFLFLAFIAAVMIACMRSLAQMDEADASRIFGAALLSGAFGFLVNCLFESAFQSTRLRFLFWILLGAALALSRWRKKAS